MPFAVIRKQKDGSNLYLKGVDENDVTEMAWTPRKTHALPFTTSDKAELVVRLISMHASAQLDVIGLKLEIEP
jgi:hypothetical protein